MPGANVYIDAYYWATDSETGSVTWTDCDLIVHYEHRLFVIEVKAGRYTHKPPGRHIRDHLKSLKDLIESAAKQANRFLEELENREELIVYNVKREQSVALRKADIVHATRCCISLDQIDDIASRAEDLVKLGIDIGTHPVWTVSLNDLLVLADVFTNPLVFIDYVGERMRAFDSPTCHVSDELDHLGLYLEHNRYVMRAERFAPLESLGWNGYRDVFDHHYSEKWRGCPGKPPAQKMPTWMEHVLHLLAQSRKSGRVVVAEFLLGMNGETRDAVAEQVKRVQTLQKHQNRPRPITCGGDVRLTISVVQKGSRRIDFAEARDHAIAVMSLQEEQDRLMLWLQYSAGGILEDVKWSLLTKADAAATDATKLAERVGSLRASREKLKTDKEFAPFAQSRPKRR